MVVGSLSVGLCSDYKGVLTALSGLLTHDHMLVEEFTEHSSCRGPNATLSNCIAPWLRLDNSILFPPLIGILSDLFQSWSKWSKDSNFSQLYFIWTVVICIHFIFDRLKSNIYSMHMIVWGADYGSITSFATTSLLIMFTWTHLICRKPPIKRHVLPKWPCYFCEDDFGHIKFVYENYF